MAKKRKVIPYNPKLTEFAKELRNNSTRAEVRLWRVIKGKEMRGYDFHRQKPLLNFIADFYCYELELVIEIDGFTHEFEETKRKDAFKQSELEKLGLTVLRFTDEEVLAELDKIFQKIEEYIDEYEERG